MKRIIFCLMALLAWTWLGAAHAPGEQCTSAVVGPAATADGRPILWKNRDTDELSNKVVFVREAPHRYLALVDAPADSGRFVYAGLNDAGFAIMNTVAYNLPAKAGEFEDLEGIIMADALRTCATVDDFESYLQANRGPNLGSLANFGVIDGRGGAALFEVHNHGYRRYDAADFPRRTIVNANFARSGAEGQGAGYLRFERATTLFAGLPENAIRFETVLTEFTRDTGHVLLDHPAPATWPELPADTPRWISTRDTINKAYTSAAVVFVGRVPGDDTSMATMWVIPGEPLTAVAVPLWVESGASPVALWQGEKAPLWQESWRLKSLIRPAREGNKDDYVDLTQLANKASTGYLARLLDTEREILRLTADFLNGQPAAADMAAFQEKMAGRALQALRAVRPGEGEK
ncbi:MAG: hypothetical protein JXQ27_08465 [Acidobacteria bacterium]|nr:hypothetical protein [Acidobacteriota bacterium]